MSDLLFVYGTLHPERAPREIAQDVKSFVEIGRGTIRGKLHLFADYPAVQLGPGLTSLVTGTIYKIPSDPHLLARLDEYEEYWPQRLQSSLFRREKVQATLSTGRQVQCWAYIYNQQIAA